jgi:4-hydroxy-tetrahydrodipicolinate synthase
LAGVLPVVQLPFFEDESIDFETLDAEVDYLFGHGADGITFAMVSEVLRLSTEERKRVAERLVQSIGDRGASIISVGAESTHCAVDFAQHAQSIGATAVMAIPPISISPLPDERLRYFERLVKSTSLPLIVQDASGYVGEPLGVDNMAKLLDEFGPQRILFKPEAVPIGPQLSALRDATAGQARVFEGSGGIALVDSYRRGIVGTMPGADLIDGIVALWQALGRGDETRTYAISRPLSALVAMQSGLDGFLAVEKYLLKKRGVFANTVVRGPIAFKLDEETRQEIDRLFQQLQDALNP